MKISFKYFFKLCPILLFFLSNFFVGSLNADYPEKPITLITPYAAGGSNDLTARVFTSYLSDYLGQQMLIKLVPGQAGQKGTLEAIRSVPDGYTLVFTDNYRDQLHQFTFPNDHYDTNEDLVPVARINYGHIAIIVRGDGPYKTWDDVESDAKLRPGKLRISHSGLWAALFVPEWEIMQNLDLRFRMIPYRGGGPAKAALLSGDVDISMAFPATVAEDVKSGRIRILATAGQERQIFDVPSFTEIGLSATTGFIHRIVMAPIEMPKDRLLKVRKALKELQNDQRYIDTMRQMGENVEYMDGVDYEEVRQQQSIDYSKLVNSIRVSK